MPERAFPVVYTHDVELSASFYQRLGFEPHVRLPAEGKAGYAGLRWAAMSWQSSPSSRPSS